MPSDGSDTGPRPGTLPERRARLLAALEAVRDQRDPKLAGWMNTWRGTGAVVDAMTAQGFDIEIQQYPHGWWARFYLTGASHPVCGGSGWATTPWGAVQAAAWETLTKGNPGARLDALLADGQTGTPREAPGHAAGPAQALSRSTPPTPSAPTTRSQPSRRRSRNGEVARTRGSITEANAASERRLTPPLSARDQGGGASLSVDSLPAVQQQRDPSRHAK